MKQRHRRRIITRQMSVARSFRFFDRLYDDITSDRSWVEWSGSLNDMLRELLPPKPNELPADAVVVPGWNLAIVGGNAMRLANALAGHKP